MPDPKRRIAYLVLFLMLMVVVVIVGLKIRDQLSPTDSSALFGGRLESDYPTAGFLVIFQDDGVVDFCGVSFTTETSGVTAAHCFDKTGQRYVGKGEFTLDKSKLVAIDTFAQKSNWDHVRSDNDLATFTLKSAIGLNGSILVGTVVEGCNYRVVAYGRTETETESLSATRPRKSAQVCVTIIDDNIVKLTGDGGICVGDSGSPVYVEGTNQVIGVISAITRSDSSKPFCYIGNTANVVRLDTNKTFLNDAFFVKSSSSSSRSTSSISSVSSSTSSVSSSSSTSSVRSTSSASSSAGGLITPVVGTLDLSQYLTDQNIFLVCLAGIVVFGGLVIYKVLQNRSKPPVY